MDAIMDPLCTLHTHSSVCLVSLSLGTYYSFFYATAFVGLEKNNRKEAFHTTCHALIATKYLYRLYSIVLDFLPPIF